ncbi:MAG: aspartate/glutamate racemase family protein [Proteobacteria bacterium]|nr:aspartate/glutamate racemase family protein [Pseudomonadota bacterium]
MADRMARDDARKSGGGRNPSASAPDGSSRMAYGGKTVYGATVGMLMLETSFPRIPGDLGHAPTWPVPVLFKVVSGATPERLNDQRESKLLDLFVKAGKELVAQGADGLTTSCGFLSLYQDRLKAECGVPVAASSLLQVPLVEALLPPGKRCGVVTISRNILRPEHLEAAGCAPDTPVQGCEAGEEFVHIARRPVDVLDVAKAEADVLNAGAELVRRHPEVGAIVMECTNMPPYAAALRNHVGLPVFNIYTLVSWFQAGLRPRQFGHPSSAPLPFRER